MNAVMYALWALFLISNVFLWVAFFTQKQSKEAFREPNKNISTKIPEVEPCEVEPCGDFIEDWLYYEHYIYKEDLDQLLNKIFKDMEELAITAEDAKSISSMIKWAAALSQEQVSRSVKFNSASAKQAASQSRQ